MSDEGFHESNDADRTVSVLRSKVEDLNERTLRAVYYHGERHSLLFEGDQHSSSSINIPASYCRRQSKRNVARELPAVHVDARRCRRTGHIPVTSLPPPSVFKFKQSQRHSNCRPWRSSFPLSIFLLTY